MEKIVSPEERIRRAEEIYNRRKTYRENYRTNYGDSINQKKGTFQQRIIKKTIIQMLVCLVIYFAFYGIFNSNQIFSESVTSNVKSFLNHDIQIESLYNTYFKNNNILNNFFGIKKNEDTTNVLNENENRENIVTEPESVGGGEIEEYIEQESKTQTELDVDFIKQNINIVWPLEGAITSGFGARTPTDIVTANHYGIDIAGKIGDPIIASMDGEVTDVSFIGDYGNHIKITNGDVETLYAHCSVICANKGDKITQGTKIAEVGSTGKSTGPHLHFEIKRDNRVINPELVLN